MIRLLTLVTLLLLKAPSGAPLGFLGPAPFATTAAGALGSVGAALPSIVASSLLAVDVVSSGLHSSLPAPEAARRGAETIAAIAAPGSVTARAVALESDRRHVACVARSAPDDFNYECQQDASPQVVVRGGRLIVVSQTWTAPPSKEAAVPPPPGVPAASAVNEAAELITTSSTGGAVWPSAMALSRYMEELGAGSSGWWAGKNVVEIGAGIGLNSLTAGSLGARSVTLTDGDTGVLRLARQNIADNELNIKVDTLRFGDKSGVDRLLSGTPDRHFDVVIGSDLTYKKDDWPAFVETVVRLSGNPASSDSTAASASNGEPTTFLYATTPRYRSEWETLQDEFRKSGFRVDDVTFEARAPGFAVDADDRYAGGVLRDDVRIMRGVYVGSSR
jgi:hypothetical protein